MCLRRKFLMGIWFKRRKNSAWFLIGNCKSTKKIVVDIAVADGSQDFCHWEKTNLHMPSSPPPLNSSLRCFRLVVWWMHPHICRALSLHSSVSRWRLRSSMGSLYCDTLYTVWSRTSFFPSTHTNPLFCDKYRNDVLVYTYIRNDIPYPPWHRFYTRLWKDLSVDGLVMASPNLNFFNSPPINR